MVTYHSKIELGGGYAGLAFTARQISEYIPKYQIYVEPFAGLGRVGEYVQADSKVFNDKSQYAYKYLLKQFPKAIISNVDFEACINNHDSENTFFLIDPPWRDAIYSGIDKYFQDRKAVEYYKRLLEILPKIKGDWFLCSSLAERGLNKILSKSGYPLLDIKSKRMICGKPATVRMISNKPFIRCSQEILCLTVEKEGSSL